VAAVVTLLSDFGTRDGFVAAMKGVILEIAPTVQVVDASHDIEPGDVEAAAFVLHQYWRLFPAGTVHLAVVDPGVGTQRRALALAAEDRFVVAPDNGLITRVLRQAPAARCAEIDTEQYGRSDPSTTFHGRDIFAPAAGHLAAGVPFERIGPAMDDPLLLRLEEPRRSADQIVGRVAHVDHFGNLITDIPAEWVAGRWHVSLAGRDVGALKRTYADVSSGQLLALIGSLGTVEVAARGDSAARATGVARGDTVICRRSD